MLSWPSACSSFALRRLVRMSSTAKRWWAAGAFLRRPQSAPAALVNNFCPLTGPGTRWRARRTVSHDDATFIFQAERFGLSALAVIVDDGLRDGFKSSERHSQNSCGSST